ncbi:hypothetical protein CMQ_6518 [Grosmannia clavigera kw1407]|uniref:Uncharacterized protein n=1 Tax=Grosmannia clavigera (strain kw1407 / UAMH 11150) TaxID=655863 RepID=F0X6I8_GROCL|nr:uncharacterized protein CMQ_6518 [Grosmannia clavigera kw1407]EFX06197.1 hypothetical protein CMQ_6518 [Grosmannia clavigera kw1407]
MQREERQAEGKSKTQDARRKTQDARRKTQDARRTGRHVSHGQSWLNGHANEAAAFVCRAPSFSLDVIPSFLWPRQLSPCGPAGPHDSTPAHKHGDTVKSSSCCSSRSVVAPFPDSPVFRAESAPFLWTRPDGDGGACASSDRRDSEDDRPWNGVAAVVSVEQVCRCCRPCLRGLRLVVGSVGRVDAQSCRWLAAAVECDVVFGKL